MKTLLLGLASFLVLITNLRAQAGGPNFERFSHDDGLAADDVHLVRQDRFGFLWIATADGLYMYDGYGFTHHQHTPFDSTSLPANAVTALHEDRHGTLWVGTVNGLARMNLRERAAGRFYQYARASDNAPGLGGYGISTIGEDASGKLWIGTFGAGLYKLDPSSNQITAYRREPGNPFGLNDDSILALHRDRTGTLWVGTAGGGLQRFDPRTERFTTFTWQHPNFSGSYRQYTIGALSLVDSLKAAPPPLAALLQIGDDEAREVSFRLAAPSYVLLIATAEVGPKGLADFGWLEQKGTKPPIWEMSHDRSRHAGGALKNRLLIDVVKLPPGDYSLHYRSDDSHSFKKWNRWPPAKPENWGIQIFALEAAIAHKLRGSLRTAYTPSAVSYHAVTCIANDPDPQSRVLWIGTAHGLNRFDPAMETFAHYFHEPNIPNSLNGNFISALAADDSGRMWIGTDAGLNLFDLKQGRFIRMRPDDGLHCALTNEKINAIFHDSSGLAWIATSNSGLFKQAPKKFFHHRVAEDEALNRVHRIYVDHAKKIWLGTANGLVYDAGDAPLRYFQHKAGAANSLGAKFITFIYEDRHGAKWIGTRGGGLNKMLDNGKFVAFRSDPNDAATLTSNFLSCIAESDDSALWIGTAFGLNRFDPTTGKVMRYLPDPNNPASLPAFEIGALLADRSGNVWVGTLLGGLSKLHPANGQIKNYLPDSNNPQGLCNRSVNFLHEGRDGTLWVGTYSGGLCALTRDENGEERFAHYTMKDGLPSNKILGILEDDDGRLWISTNQGLARFDPAAPAGKKVRLFSLSDGLQGLQFYLGACFRSGDGEMFFGGANGFNRFFPHLVKEEPHAAPVVLTNFKLFDRVKAFDLPLPELPEIQLRHHENFFALEFVALDYTSTENLQYAYKLEGLEEDWTYCGERRYANYTNVEPGEYVFRMKASNNDGAWNEPGASIRLVIAPPFWRTWWFYLASFGATLLAAYALFQYRLRAQVKKSLELERVRLFEREKVREQIARDYHDEMGHKITKVALFTEVITKNVNGIAAELKEHLGKVVEASQSLSLDARDFIWALNPEKDSFYEMCLHLQEFGNALFEEAEVNFQVQGLSEELSRVKLNMEWKRHLTLLFKEGMNNALKHARCKNVVLEVSEQNGILHMSLFDDGVGLSRVNGHARPGFPLRSFKENRGNGAGLENMKRRAQLLHGHLEISSPEGRGTMIQFSSEIPKNGY
jgi:ligand-binding sensor domain-containing protein/signal transduction histidine kinase